MSYFDDASLVMIPSGYKDQKVYSVKPIDGSGDLTFSRASNATRVNSSGLVEKVRTNLLNYSNTFNGTGWTLNDATLTSGQSGYDGTSNAWKLTEGSATAEHYVRQTPSVSGLLTISIYAKADTQDWLYFRGVTGGVNVRAWFDLQNGVVGTTDGSVLSRSIQSVGGGWYRCSMVWSHQSGFECYIAISNADGVTTYAGDGTSSILIQASQLETGDIATDYIATTSTAVSVGPVSGLPRLDYSGGASCPSLLLEPQRTNVLQYSEEINSAFLNQSSSGTGAFTITSNYGVSPDGYQNADRIQMSATGGSGNYADILYASAPYTSGVPHTYSVYVKSLNGTPTVGLLWNGSTTINQQITTEWVRYTFTFTPTSSAYPRFLIEPASGTSTSADILVWGWQLEQNASYATSYIPTLSSAVTRVLDQCEKTATFSNVQHNNCTLFYDFEHLGNLSVGQNQFLCLFGVGKYFNFAQYDNSTFYVDTDINGSYFFTTAVNTTLGRKKVAIKIDGLSWKIFFNGVKVHDTTLTQQSTAALSEINLGGRFGSVAANHAIHQVLALPAISDADCITLTTL